MFLAELGLALISRFAPQLQVFFLAMPVKSGIAMFLLIIYIGYLLEYVKDELGNVEMVIDRLSGILQ
jgi:type III secretion protein T